MPEGLHGYETTIVGYPVYRYIALKGYVQCMQYMWDSGHPVVHAWDPPSETHIRTDIKIPDFFQSLTAWLHFINFLVNLHHLFQKLEVCSCIILFINGQAVQVELQGYVQ